MKLNTTPVVALCVIGAALFSSCVSERGTKSAGQQAGFKTVDLADYYGKRAGSWRLGSSWSVVPWGKQTYDGVPFELGGVLELTGIDAARRVGEVFPGRYTGIPVEARGPWIHLVLAVGWKEADGVPIAQLALHYENGRTSHLPIIYGVNVRNWWKEPSETDARLADPNSKVIWSAPNPEPVGRPVELRLYKTSLPNPHPEWVIARMDLESLFTHATPVVVALTVGGPGDGLKRGQVRPISVPGWFTRRLVIRAADTGQPISSARVQVALSDGERTYPFGAQTTDAHGRTTLAFSREQVSQLILHVSAPEFTTLQFTRNILDLPPEFDLKLQAKP